MDLLRPDRTASGTAFDDAERRAWAGRAPAYEATFARLCAATVEPLLDAAGVARGGVEQSTAVLEVLDVGTGTGSVAVAAAARGAHVTAVDAEPGMVARTAELVPSADVQVATVPGLPFAEGSFDAVAGNFVLNHVGRPRAALADLRRVLRPDGRVALTIWASPGTRGQSLVPRALAAAGAVRPEALPMLDDSENFVRTADGLAALLAEAGFDDAGCRAVEWDHVVDADTWWSGPAAGIAAVGQTLTAQAPEVQVAARERYDELCTEVVGTDGLLHLPHRALLVAGVAR